MASPTTSSHASPSDAADDDAPTGVRGSSLDRLDVALFASRRWVKRPGHRRRFFELLDRPVNLTTLRVLRAVERHDGGDPTIGEVASAIGVDPSSASRFVDAAVARGDLERRPCQRDRRRTRVSLTASGRDSLASSNRARRAVLEEVTAGWDDADVQALTSLLDRLGDGFDALEAGR